MKYVMATICMGFLITAMMYLAAGAPKCPELAAAIFFMFLSQCAYDMTHEFSRH